VATVPNFAPGVLASSSLNALGDIVQDADDALNAAWVSYTPTWSTSATQPVLNNGTLTGRYRLFGSGLVHVEIAFKAGSTTTYGTGQWAFSLPAAASAAASSVEAATGPLYINDSGTTSRTGCCVVSSSTDLALEATTGGITATAPQTWANNDQIRLSIAYQPT
jgi:hypothetical protein